MVKIVNTATHTPSDPDETSWVYNGLDCALTAEIYEVIVEQLDEVTGATYKLEKDLQAPVLEMNMTGVQIDFAQLKRKRAEMEKIIDRLGNQLTRIVVEGCGFESFNWRSAEQVKMLLYSYLRLPEVKKRNDRGQFVATVDRSALERLEGHFIARPIIRHMLIIRDIEKKLSFLKTNIDADGRLRTSFNIAGTDTGRLASAHSDFGTGRNLQNVDRALRQMFVASKGKRLCNIDLEQADSRNVGATCWQKLYGQPYVGRYLDACESGDLHTTVTEMIWPELDWDSGNKREVADQIFYRDYSYRDMSKRGGHGTNYVATPPTMAKHLHITKPIAQDFQDKYFGAFPEIKENHKAVRKQLRQTSQLTTIWGRRRTFFGRPDDEATVRKAVAFEGQAATADEINIGLVNLYKGNWPGFRILLQVHDSVLFEYDEECENEIVPWAIEQLTVGRTLAGGRYFEVPCEAKVGWNWGDFSKENPDGLVKWKGEPDRRTRKHIVSYK